MALQHQRMNIDKNKFQNSSLFIANFQDEKSSSLNFKIYLLSITVFFNFYVLKHLHIIVDNID